MVALRYFFRVILFKQSRPLDRLGLLESQCGHNEGQARTELVVGGCPLWDVGSR